MGQASVVRQAKIKAVTWIRLSCSWLAGLYVLDKHYMLILGIIQDNRHIIRREPARIVGQAEQIRNTCSLENTSKRCWWSWRHKRTWGTCFRRAPRCAWKRPD